MEAKYGIIGKTDLMGFTPESGFHHFFEPLPPVPGAALVRVGTRRSSRENPAHRWRSVLPPSPFARSCPPERESRLVSASRSPSVCRSCGAVGLGTFLL